jgi:hypothetical protein
MKYGVHEKRTDLGKFTSDKCRACKKGIQYRMEKSVKYFTLFSIPLVPLRVRYESVCDRCGAGEPVKNYKARSLSRRYFRRAQLSQQFLMVLRLALAAAVIAAAVILPLTVRIHVNADPETLKALVTEEGDYGIKDGDDNLLATVHVENGVKTLTWYDKVSVLTNTGSRGGTFYLHEYFKEAADSAGNTILIRDADDPGRLMDQYDSIVRLYSYDEENGTRRFYQGVEDLSSIRYTPDKVTYLNFNYDEQGVKQQYVTVLYILSNAQVSAQFMEAADGSGFSRLVAVGVDSYSRGRVTDQRYYYFADDTITLAAQAGLTQESGAQAFSDFIRENKLSPLIAYQFEYYGNTRVVASETGTLPDANGDMRTQTTQYQITAVDGYYVFPYSG